MGARELGAHGGRHPRGGVRDIRITRCHHEHRIEGAEVAQEPGGRLLADARNAREAVGRVAAQHREVGVLRRLDAVLRDDPLAGHQLEPAHAARGVDHADPPLVVDELEQVPVARDDVDRHRRLRRHRADDVVGLVLGDAHHRDAEQAQHLADHRHLRLERVGHLLDVGAARHDLLDAVRLVARDEVDPPLRPPVVVPAGDEMGRLEVAHELRDHVEQPAHRVHGRAVGAPDRVGHAVERTEVQRGGVEQHQTIGHGAILSQRTHSQAGRIAEQPGPLDGCSG
ncbi:hypothetical protein AVP42_00490 [Agromyces sp. NDB4Y10]|nr:hypothetical protein AVP42_00490 [Agromyces sp. NDB4Y10]